MLEQKINDLTAAVDHLNETILTLISSLGVKPSTAAPVEPAPVEPAPVEPAPVESVAEVTLDSVTIPVSKTPKPVKAPKEERAPVPPTPPQVTLTREEVQDFCLELIRFDRSLRPDLDKCVFSFGGAKKLPDVSQADLPALHAMLLKLKPKDQK